MTDYQTLPTNTQSTWDVSTRQSKDLRSPRFEAVSEPISVALRPMRIYKIFESDTGHPTKVAICTSMAPDSPTIPLDKFSTPDCPHGAAVWLIAHLGN